VHERVDPTSAGASSTPKRSARRCVPRTRASASRPARTR
jgi:hypothetical protein